MLEENLKKKITGNFNGFYSLFIFFSQDKEEKEYAKYSYILSAEFTSTKIKGLTVKVKKLKFDCLKNKLIRINFCFVFFTDEGSTLRSTF